MTGTYSVFQKKVTFKFLPVSSNGFFPVWFGMVTVLSIVLPRRFLLCPFHKKLRVLREEVPRFLSNQRFVSSYIVIHIDNLLVEIWKYGIYLLVRLVPGPPGVELGGHSYHFGRSLLNTKTGL